MFHKDLLERSPEASKKTYDRHDNDSTVMETPFIKTRQLLPGGISQDWLMHLFPTLNSHACNLKSKLPHSCWYHKSPLSMDFFILLQEVQSDSLETLSHTPCAIVMHLLGNVRNSLTIVLLLQCHSCWFFHSPAPKESAMENFLPVPFHLPAPSFVSLDGRD